MSLKMSEKSREEVLQTMRERYAGRGRKGRTKLIDEFCELCGYERKYAIKLLRGQRREFGRKVSKSGSKPKYGDEERAVLKRIWLAAEQPCGKRLKAALTLWLPHYEAERGNLDEALRGRILTLSAATIDRLLGPRRAARHQSTSRQRECTSQGPSRKSTVRFAPAASRCGAMPCIFSCSIRADLFI